MKKIILSIVFLFSFIAASAQAADPFSVVIVNEVDMKKYDIYKGTLLWIADTQKSSINVIQINDWESGVIVGEGTSEIEISAAFGLGSSVVTINYNLLVETKNQKYRLTFSDITTIVQIRGTMEELPVEEMDFEKTKPLLKIRFNELAKSLHAFLLKSMKDNW